MGPFFVSFFGVAVNIPYLTIEHLELSGRPEILKKLHRVETALIAFLPFCTENGSCKTNQKLAGTLSG